MGGSSWGWGELVREGAPITRGVQAEAHRQGCWEAFRVQPQLVTCPVKKQLKLTCRHGEGGAAGTRLGREAAQERRFPPPAASYPPGLGLPVSKAGAINLLCKELFGPWLSTGALGMLFHFILVTSFHVGAPLILILTDREPRPQGSSSSPSPESQPPGSSPLLPASPPPWHLPGDERAWERPGPCCLARHRRHQFPPFGAQTPGSPSPGGSGVSRPPTPTAVSQPPFLGSAGGPEAARAAQPSPLSSPRPAARLRRHQRVPGQQRRLRPLLPQHRGQLRVRLPEGVQAADGRADVPR